MPTKLAEEMMTKIETRGGHAWGWAYKEGDTFYYHKQPGKYVGSNTKFPKTQLFIGHTRFATHGRPEQNENNHPHVNSHHGIMMVHNGVVSNKHEKQETQCDSEAILKILVDQLNCKSHPPVKIALKNAAEKIDGSFRLGVLSTAYPEQIFAVSDDGDALYFGFHPEYICFASEEKDLPDECAKMRACGNRVYIIDKELHIEALRFKKLTRMYQSSWKTNAVWDAKSRSWVDYEEMNKNRPQVHEKKDPALYDKNDWVYTETKNQDGTVTCRSEKKKKHSNQVEWPCDNCDNQKEPEECAICTKWINFQGGGM